MTIKISFILCSRNDNYCGNSPERLFTSLYVLVTLLEKYKLNYCEIVLVDWNSNIPLNQLNDYNKIKNYKNLNYIIIPPDIAKKYSKIPVSEVHALNVAAKCAKGKLLLRLDQDTIIGQRFIEYLKNCPENDYNKIWWSSRRETEQHHYNDIILDPFNFIRKNGDLLPLWCNKKYKYGEGAVGIFGIPKQAWILEKGYNEHMMGWGHMEVEFCKRLKNNLEWLHIDDITNVDFYHIWHTRDMKEHNSHLHDYPPNSDNWGLIGII
jgi:hypothetical protein